MAWVFCVCWPQLGRWEDCHLSLLTITDIIMLRSSSLKVNREFQSRVTLWQAYAYVLLALNISLNCNSVLLLSYKNGHLGWLRAAATHKARGHLSCDGRWGRYHKDEMVSSELRNWKDQVNSMAVEESLGKVTIPTSPLPQMLCPGCVANRLEKGGYFLTALPVLGRVCRVTQW